MEEKNCGSDLSSLKWGEFARYIEVRGRAGVGDITLTPNEAIKVQWFGDLCWLYVVICKNRASL